MIQDEIMHYKSGIITGYQLMIDSLMTLDPSVPGITLSDLPEEVLDELLAYARRYLERPRGSSTRELPAEAQVRAAHRWIVRKRLTSFLLNLPVLEKQHKIHIASTFYEIKIYFPISSSEPPHFFAEYRGSKDVVNFDVSQIFEGYLPARARRLISEWVDERQDKLSRSWEVARRGQTLFSIPGLDETET